MKLNLSQEQVLNEMAIPIWVRRQRSAQTNDDHLPIIDERLNAVDCLILIDGQTYNEQAHRLLDAMLFSIGLCSDQVALIKLEQIAEIAGILTDKKLLLVFGQSAIEALTGKKNLVSDYRGKTHKNPNVACTTIVSIGLDVLLESPENKASVWQDLQLVKRTHQALLSS